MCSGNSLGFLKKYIPLGINQRKNGWGSKAKSKAKSKGKVRKKGREKKGREKRGRKKEKEKGEGKMRGKG
jgi:hypothetical protein